VVIGARFAGYHAARELSRFRGGANITGDLPQITFFPVPTLQR